MKFVKPFFLVCAFAIYFSAASCAFSFVRYTAEATNGSVIFAHWPESSFPIPYYIVDNDITRQVPGGTEFVTEAVGRAFEAWEEVETTTASFVFAGYLAGWEEITGAVVVHFQDLADDGHMGGITSVDWDEEESGEEIRAATVRFFGPVEDWGDLVEREPPGAETDLQGVATHEFGHVLGLSHSPIAAATMWPDAYKAVQQRSLHTDDIAGVSTIYPAEGYFEGTAAVSGHILTGRFVERPVFGAHVSVIDGSTNEELIGCMSGFDSGRFGDGHYWIPGLAGERDCLILVYPVEDAALGPFYEERNKDFLREYFSGAEEDLLECEDIREPVRLISGREREGADLVVNKAQTALSLSGVTRLHYASSEFSCYAVQAAASVPAAYLDHVSLWYKPDADAWASLPMAYDPRVGYWKAAIPRQPSGSTVSYYVEAATKYGCVDRVPADGEAAYDFEVVPVGVPPFHVYFSGDGQYASSLCIGAAGFPEQVATVPFSEITDIEVSEDGKRVYVIDADQHFDENGGGGFMSSVYILDADPESPYFHTVTGRIVLDDSPLFSPATNIVLLPGSGRAIVSYRGRFVFYVVDLESGCVVEEVSLGYGVDPNDFAPSHDGHAVFAVFADSTMRSFSYEGSLVEEAVLPLPEEYKALKYSPATQRLYALAKDDARIMVIDPNLPRLRYLRIENVISIPREDARRFRMTMSPAGTELYVEADTGDPSHYPVCILDLSSQEWVASFDADGPYGPGTKEMAFNRPGDLLFVPTHDSAEERISVYDVTKAGCDPEDMFAYAIRTRVRPMKVVMQKNFAPALSTSRKRYAVRAGRPLSVHIAGNDVNGELLHLATHGLPGGAAARIVRLGETNNWTLFWTPARRHLGRHEIELVATDDAGATASQSVIIWVIP